MVKNFFKLMMIAVAFVFIGCNDDDGGGNEYNPDTAVSSYRPSLNPKVATISLKNTDVDNRTHKRSYSFEYDAQNRIKTIDMVVNTYGIYKNRAREFNVNSKAYYYFTENNGLRIDYSTTGEMPKIDNSKITFKRSYNGVFDNNGVLEYFGSFDCEYNFTNLSSAHLDNGRKYTFHRDDYGNINGYSMYSATSGTTTDVLNEYQYSEYINRTNFDFAAFIGGFVLEREFDDDFRSKNEEGVTKYYAWEDIPFQLGSFAMCGVCSYYLPAGEWTFNSAGLPVKFTHDSGYKMEITYEE